MSDEKIILGLDALRSVGHSDKARAIKDEIDRLRAENERVYEDGVSRLIEAQKLNNREIESLRAELTEARLQLKDASEQEPVGCMSPEQFSILTGDPVDNGVHVRIWQVYNPPSRAKSGVKLYAAPVTQPAVPEAVRKLIEQLLSDYESATEEEYSGTSYYAGRVEFQNHARAILSADTEGRKDE